MPNISKTLRRYAAPLVISTAALASPSSEVVGAEKGLDPTSKAPVRTLHKPTSTQKNDERKLLLGLFAGAGLGFIVALQDIISLLGGGHYKESAQGLRTRAQREWPNDDRKRASQSPQIPDRIG